MSEFSLLCDHLAGLGPAAVAFSGGVDSSLLLAAACRVYGERVVALHGRTPLQAAGEYENALAIAASLGCRPLVVELNPYDWPEVTANTPRRCYHCKSKLYRIFLAQAARQGRFSLLDGTNLDDLAQERPGLAALAELGVKMPLAACGLDKQKVRALALACKLPNWDKPSASCLATRIMDCQTITPAKIALVAKAEEFLRQKKFLGCRFRHCGERCMVEVRSGDFPRLQEEVIWSEIESFCRLLGFAVVERGRRPVEG